MKIWKRPRSPYYSYLFQYKDRVYCRSTGTKNRREAEDIAAAARARIVRQAAGLEKPEAEEKSAQLKRIEKPRVSPTLSEFQATFNEWVGNGEGRPTGDGEVLSRKLSEVIALHSLGPPAFGPD